MTFKWPALSAELLPHTVDTPRGVLSGFLVRCTRSHKELGYVWQAGSTWRWKTPDGQHYGERSAQRTAVAVLREAFDLAAGVTGRLPFEPEPPGLSELREQVERIVRKPLLKKPPKTEARPPSKPRIVKPPPAPPAPEKRIQWNTVAPMGDVTAALSDALRDKK